MLEDKHYGKKGKNSEVRDEECKSHWGDIWVKT